MNVICFGDSNTYGYDPRSYLGGRYAADSRWVDILAEETGWTVRNLGENGREIPTSVPDFPADTDLLIIMLGTNDLLQGRSPEQAVKRLDRFLSGISLDRSKILVIAPPPMTLGAWVPASSSLMTPTPLSGSVRPWRSIWHLLRRRGKWDIPLAYDGVHFMEQGHRAFAAGLLEELK